MSKESQKRIATIFALLGVALTIAVATHNDRTQQTQQTKRAKARDYCLKHPPHGIRPAATGNDLTAEEQELDFTIRQCNIALGKEDPQ